MFILNTICSFLNKVDRLVYRGEHEQSLSSSLRITLLEKKRQVYSTVKSNLEDKKREGNGVDRDSSVSVKFDIVQYNGNIFDRMNSESLEVRYALLRIEGILVLPHIALRMLFNII